MVSLPSQNKAFSLVEAKSLFFVALHLLSLASYIFYIYKADDITDQVTYFMQFLKIKIIMSPAAETSTGKMCYNYFFSIPHILVLLDIWLRWSVGNSESDNDK